MSRQETCNSPKNRNLSADSPNLLSLKACGLSGTRSLLAFLVFLFGGDRLRFSPPPTDLAWTWKLFSPCSKPSNLRYTFIIVKCWKCTYLLSPVFVFKSPRSFLSFTLWGLRMSIEEFKMSLSSKIPVGVIWGWKYHWSLFYAFSLFLSIQILPKDHSLQRSCAACRPGLAGFCLVQFVLSGWRYIFESTQETSS